MAKKVIDIRDNIDYINPMRRRHKKLVLGELFKNIGAFVTQHQIPIASAPEGEMIPIEVPMKEEHRFGFGFAPFGEQGRGAGQSSIPQAVPQEGEQEGQGQQGGGEPGRRLSRGMEVGRLQEGQQPGGQARFGLGEGEGEEQEGSPDEGGVKAGRSPGQDRFETEINVEDLRDKISKDFDLPDLDEKSLSVLKVRTTAAPHGYRNKGPLSQLRGDKTFEKYIERTGQEETEEDTVMPEDFRFPRKEPDEKFLTNLLLLFVHDGSGSITAQKLAAMRAIAMWWVRAGRKTHQEVVLAFVTFHTQAEERTEIEFVYLASSGGTKISSGSKKGHEIILHGSKYHPYPNFSPDEWNIGTVFLTDGENDYSDMQAMYESFRELCEFVKFFAYYEVYATGNVVSSKEIKKLDQEYDNFIPFSIKEEKHVRDGILAVLEKLKNSRREVSYA